MNEFRDTKLLSAKNTALFDLIACCLGSRFERILVIGCGTGREAIGLSQRFNAEVFGIDLTDKQFVKNEYHRVTLRVMNACKMDYPNATFDLIYSFHALEHIHPLNYALAEMRRVLKRGGAFCLGTPNKSRVVGYIGAAATLKFKLRWNLADWKMRAMRCWSNEFGAHAGFTRHELRGICLRTFGEATDVTYDYYRALYGQRRRKLVSFLLANQIRTYLLQSVYMLGRCR
jgi:SAM-dependent methyltransferase